ncbi:MAG: AAA family ATPase [Thiohalobacteraceae bacterium]
MDATEQSRLIAALQNPARFPHPVDRVQVIQTHISYVLLTGRYAYKFKKPVNLGFLDFTSLEKRRFYCHEELRLNRRLAPELYEAVVKITGTPEDPGFDGPGEPIEYAVRMRQFPDGARLDEVCDRGDLTAVHIDQLADTIAAFHRNAPAASREQLYGTAAGVGDRVLQNFEQIAAHCTDEEVSRQLQTLRAWSDRCLDELHDDLEARRREGWIRECHGDLHLANMALIDDRVVIFDALEFAEDLRWIDPLCEVAFLYMDLEHRGRRSFARRFLNNYLEAANDYQGLALFRHYLVYRAMVRAKVAAIEAHQHHKNKVRTDTALETVRSYLELAIRYSLPAERMPIIALHGFSGSGKSWLGKRLLETLGAVRIRSDVERKRLLGLSPDACTESAVARGAYTAEISQETYRRLPALAYPIVDAGFPVILDATYLLRSQRNQIRRLAAVAAVPFVILDVQAPESVLRERITHRKATERDASEATLAVLDRQLTIAEPLGPDEREHTIPVDTTKSIDLEELGRAILARP